MNSLKTGPLPSISSPALLTLLLYYLHSYKPHLQCFHFGLKLLVIFL